MIPLLLMLIFFSFMIKDAYSQTASTGLNEFGVYVSLPNQYPSRSFGPEGFILGSIAMGFKSPTIHGDVDFDGADLVIQVAPSSFPMPFDYTKPSCEVGKQITRINNMDALRINTKCFVFDTDAYTEEYFIQASDKVVHILYQALDEYAYNLHHPEVMRILNSLQVTNSLPIRQ
jgi:hypothetical protein